MNLSVSDKSDARIDNSAVVTIPAGQAIAFFSVTVFNDNSDEPTETLTILANAPLPQLTASITESIIDTTPAVVAISVNPTSFNENGGSATVTVTRNTSSNNPLFNQALLLDLTSSDLSEARVPSTVTIPAGQSSATSIVNAVDDLIFDESQVVALRASGNRPVTLDSTFDQDGYVATAFDTSSQGSERDVRQLPGGRIIAVGENAPGRPDNWQVAVYLPNGAPDTSFGVGGIASANFGPRSSSDFRRLGDFAVLPNGQILLVGQTSFGGPDVFSDFAVYRMNPNGTPDATFGVNGLKKFEVLGDFGNASAVVTEADNSFTVIGSQGSNVMLMRFLPNGELDPNYGVDGKVTHLEANVGRLPIAAQAERLADGSIVINSYSTSVANQLGLTKFKADGSLDFSFGTRGVAAKSFPDFSQTLGQAVAIQVDGKFLVAGFGRGGSSTSEDMIAVRFNADGSADPGFASSGAIRYGYQGGLFDQVSDIVITSDQRILLAGQFANPSSGNTGYALGILALRPDGAIDTNFGINGTFFGPALPSIFESIQAASIDSTGRLLALVGYSNDIQIARYNIADSNLSATTTVTVTDDEPVPLTISNNGSSAEYIEGTGVINLTVTRAGSLTRQLIVDVTKSGPAEITIPRTLTFPPGVATASLVTRPLNDSIQEPNEGFSIQVGKLGETTIASLSGVVIDDDPPPTLLLSVAPAAKEVLEGHVIYYTLTRLGVNSSLPLVVSLANSSPADLIAQMLNVTPPTIDSTITIPAGFDSITFFGFATVDGIDEPNESVTLIVSSPGFLSDAETVVITDVDEPTLTISLPNGNRLREGSSVTGTVTRNTAANQIGFDLPLTILLSTSDSSELRVPASLVIPASASSINFEVDGLNDDLVDSDQLVNIMASADIFVGATKFLIVENNDTSELVFGIQPSVVEGGDTTIIVGFTTPLESSQSVNIDSNMLSTAYLPSGFVTIPAGQRFATGTNAIHSVNDGVYTGNQIVEFKASLAGFSSIRQTLLVLDDEVVDIDVGFGQSSVSETAGTIIGTVRLANPLAFDLNVSLASSMNIELKVPPTIQIPAGTVVAEFTATVVDDLLRDGNQSVTITAMSSFDTSSTYIIVSDNGGIRIQGTPGQDEIEMRRRGNDVEVKSRLNRGSTTTTTFEISNTSFFVIEFGAGNDQLDVNPNISIPIIVDGGAGKDRLTTGSGNDSIVDFLDDNEIASGGGNDRILTGDGRDKISGGDGDDTIDAGNGANDIDGDNGNDHIAAGSGVDKIHGGQGDDFIRGGAGSDQLYGEQGIDILLGEDGNDQIFAGDGADLLIGGTGSDQLFGQDGGDLLIAGTTSFDNDDDALLAIVSEWNRSESYENRIRNLRMGVGVDNRIKLIASVTIQNDNSRDLLNGGSGVNWYFANVFDDVLSKKLNEIVDRL